MAQLSRNARKKARVRRSLSLVSKDLRSLTAAYQRTYVTLLTLLGQAGGEVTVTGGTAMQVMQDIKSLSWETVPGVNANESIVRLLTSKIPEPVEDAPPVAEPRCFPAS